MQAKLEAAKNGIVRDMFIRTADENYITARWCASNSLFTDFLWLSLHSVEKYLKAALLLNGQFVKGSSHNISGLFSDFQKIAGEFLPTTLQRPPRLDMDWRDQNTSDFVQGLASGGDPHNRYLMYGHITDPEDVHRLDILVFAIRRACHNLDTLLLQGQPDQFSIRQALRENPKLTFSQGLPLDWLITAKDTPLRRAALNLNFAFAPADYLHMPDHGSSSDHVSPLDTYFFDNLDSPRQESQEVAIELGRWLLDNVQLPGDLKSKIRASLAAKP